VLILVAQDREPSTPHVGETAPPDEARDRARVTGTAIAAGAAMTATGYVWRPIRSDDDLDTRVEKTAQNVDELRKWIEPSDQRSRDGPAEVRTEMGEQVTAIRTDLDQQTEEDRRITSRAIRYQVLGLVAALVGALLSTVVALG
jgi:hypothetical protein